MIDTTATNFAHDSLLRLRPRDRRGSKPRCHYLTHGTPEEVAARLTALIAPFGTVSPTDRWMPKGFGALDEAQLHNAPDLIERALGGDLHNWWLAVRHTGAKTPNLDIASTCTIDGKRGLMIVEAKAHHGELEAEAIGKKLSSSASARSLANHARIGAAIEEARVGLSEATGLSWGISRDSHYQMSNRFAWAWKVAEAGIPVVLVYLGFLGAGEMASGSRRLLSGHDDWAAAVRRHSDALFSLAIWESSLPVGRVTVTPVIRSLRAGIGVS